MNELEAFHRFLGDQLANGHAALTPEECVNLWRARNPADDEVHSDVRAIKEALDDMAAGDHGIPLQDFLAEVRHETLPLMAYTVTVLAHARQDVWEIHEWIATRSPAGAGRWLDRFDKATDSLRGNPLLFPLAPESRVLKIEVRHVLFRTRQGRTYRVIYTVNDDQVRILRVRGAGQPPVKPDDIIM